MKVYKSMARISGALGRNIESGNTEWRDKHIDQLRVLIDRYLPHGSGIDSETTIDHTKSNEERLVLYSSYHTMDENGFYGRWIDFTLTLTGSLAFGFDLKVTGNFGRDQDIKEYLGEMYNEAFDGEAADFAELKVIK